MLMSCPASVLTPNTSKNASTGAIARAAIFTGFLRSNTKTAPDQRPIIRLPQYMEMNGAISAAEYPPNSGLERSSPMLLPMATSTPTYANKAISPRTNCGYCIAPHPSLFLDAL